MSSLYPISGCGLPSKPRVNEPSMYEILSWPGEKQLAQSRFQQPQQRTVIPQRCSCNCNHTVVNCCTCCQPNKNDIPTAHPNKTIVQQIYKVNKSPQKETKSLEKVQTKTTNIVQDNQSKTFTKSGIYPKQIKNYLYSYEPVNLKASKSKSTLIVPKETKKQLNQTKKQEPQLDEKTIGQRKQKLKEFQVFTRVLPNSAFTTYYGKPAFEAYGRGTSCNNLKSFNVMPHKGDNHPKHLESHYTALIKARNVKSKSHLPRKPVDQEIAPSLPEENQQNAQSFQLPLEKPDLIKSKRFATITPQTSKKAGPPIVSRNRRQELKQSKTASKPALNQQKYLKTSKQPKKVNDGLKYMNNRQNLIDLLQEKKLKASQLAYKVTECYPLELDISQLQKSAVSKENWDEFKPAGKATLRGDLVSDLIHSKLVLSERN